MLKLALLRSKFPYLFGGSLVSDENVEVPDEARALPHTILLVFESALLLAGNQVLM